MAIHRSAIAPNVTADFAGSVHVPVTWSLTWLLSHVCASAFRPNSFSRSRPSSPT
ncbi:hypothetical protein ACK12G_07200 [Mycolicibacterium wolinskyi]|uniref:hypothetical protein n=1 Tax=Mycolicibacterium wolinskyi TaxID=59750 RepID=UPI0039176FCA